MTLCARSDRTANQNTAPRARRIRLRCPDGFPPLAHRRPVYVTHNPSLDIEILAPDACYHPEIVSLSDLTRAGIARLAGRPVLSFLMTRTFDALDLASLLNAAAHSGGYVALGHDVPDRALIRREVLFRAPAVDFDVFSVGYEVIEG